MQSIRHSCTSSLVEGREYMMVLFRVKLREGRDFKCERHEYVLWSREWGTCGDKGDDKAKKEWWMCQVLSERWIRFGPKNKKDNTSTKLEKRKRRDDFQEVEKSVYWALIFSIK